jgi:hypothetical protein
LDKCTTFNRIGYIESTIGRLNLGQSELRRWGRDNEK